MSVLKIANISKTINGRSMKLSKYRNMLKVAEFGVYRIHHF